MSYYDATQMQRRFGREIRKARREQAALGAAGQDSLEAQAARAKVRELRAGLKDFLKQTGLSRKYERKQVVYNSINLDVKSKNMINELNNLSPDGILEIGELDKEIVSQWTSNIEDNLSIVLTGKQRDHYINQHPEMKQYESNLFDAVFYPNEIHRNKFDEMMAIFYKIIDNEHYLRIAILMQENPGILKHSIISYRLCGIREIEAGRKDNRVVWIK